MTDVPRAPQRAATAVRPPLHERVKEPALTAGGLALATIAVAVRDPHREGSWGFCPFYLITGVPCPMCGGLRAVNDLAHGHVAEAVASNALLVLLLLPALVLGLAVWGARRWRGRGSEPFPWATMTTVRVLIVVVAVWGTARLIVPGHLLG